MAAVVMKAIGAGGVGDAANQVVDVAQAAGKIMDIVRDQTAKAHEAARTADNEFNIRKNFLDNTVNAIKEATLGQYNIVICTDQSGDDFQQLTGQIMGLDLVDVEVGDGKIVNFQVYIFNTGKYLRRGKWERDSWWYYGQSNVWHDIAMHVDFDNAQPKLNPDDIEKQQDKQDGEAETTDAVNAATSGGGDENEGTNGTDQNNEDAEPQPEAPEEPTEAPEEPAEEQEQE
ncbi:hypothetical protein B0O99DRAFT_713619 [Bisporella sp. PMI_857]|nr:hypothetical protein B0O99DRAFT_713619 [Bisporella sp. PMI_857]